MAHRHPAGEGFFCFKIFLLVFAAPLGWGGGSASCGTSLEMGDERPINLHHFWMVSFLNTLYLKKGMSLVHFVILPRNVFFLMLNLPCPPADFHANFSLCASAFMWSFLVLYNFIPSQMCKWVIGRLQKKFRNFATVKRNSEQSWMPPYWICWAKNFWLSHVHRLKS